MSERDSRATLPVATEHERGARARGSASRGARVVRAWLVAWVAAGVVAAVGVGCGQSSRREPEPPRPTAPRVAPQVLALRLALVRDVAGWTAPCGCSPHQLGGLHHLAALLETQERVTPERLLLATGPLFFSTTTLACQAAQQKRSKAEVVADALRRMGLVAWAPGADDWASGSAGLAELAQRSGATLLAAGLADADGEPAGSLLLRVGSLRVGLVGVSEPRTPGGRTPTGVRVPPVEELYAAAQGRVQALTAEGAELVVALAALGYPGALELAERVPGLALVVAGSGFSSTAVADRGHPPARVGSTLVVEPPNHGQALVTVDVMLDPSLPRLHEGRVALETEDAVAYGTRVTALLERERAIQVFLQHNAGARDAGAGAAGSGADAGAGDAGAVAAGSGDADADAGDTGARDAGAGDAGAGDAGAGDAVASVGDAGRGSALVEAFQEEYLRIQRELADLVPGAPPQGHYLRYGIALVDAARGTDPQVAALLAAHAARVERENRLAFGDRLPLAPLPGGAGYVGVRACAVCHADVVRGWQTTRHARAYLTLETRGRQYDLECVGCHVTGFDRPGGAALFANDELRGVQCEECHGPGSLHAANPTTPGLVVRAHEPRWCVDSCHHAPQVEGFEPAAKLPLILGPAHGRELPAPPPTPSAALPAPAP